MRLTERAMRAVVLAKNETLRLDHAEVTPAHLLLGIVKEGSGAAAGVLKNMHNGLNLKEVQEIYERIKPSKAVTVDVGPMPTSADYENVMVVAKKEAEELGHNYVGTEHLLIALIRQKDADVEAVLAGLNLNPAEVLNGTLELLGVETDVEKIKDRKESDAHIMIFADLRRPQEAIRGSIRNIVADLGLSGIITTTMQVEASPCSVGPSIPYMIIRGTNLKEIKLIANRIRDIHGIRIEVQQIADVLKARPPAFEQPD